MEKRFLTFVILSMCILIGYQALEMKLNPPPPAELGQPEATPEAQENQRAEENQNSNAEVSSSEAAGDTLATDVSASEAAIADSETSAPEQGNTDDSGTRQDLPRTWATIGTLDNSRPEKLLVWLTSQGAAIECMAINDSRYTDLDDNHGYLGYLALEETAQGLQIGAVGQGTPASIADLRAGDIIRQIDNERLVTRADFERWAETTRPQQQVKITVLRAEKTRDNASAEKFAIEVTAKLDRRPLEIIHPESAENGTALPDHPLSYLLGLHQLGKTKVEFGKQNLPGLPSLHTANWELHPVDDGSRAVEFHYVLSADQLKPLGVAGPLRIIKRFELANPQPNDDNASSADYHLHYRIIFRNENTGGQPIALAYSQSGPTGLPLEGWWYTYKSHPTKFGSAGVRDVISKAVGGSHKMFTNPNIVQRLDKNPSSPNTPMYENESFRLNYVGVDAQYFTSALLSDSLPAVAATDGAVPTNDDILFADALALPIPPKDPVKSSRTDVSFQLISPLHDIAAGRQLEQNFRIFAGPKKPSVLEKYGMGDCITYGWFRYVAQFLQMVLHTFYSIFRNYGIAIILLTVMVRGLLYPFGRKQALNAQKMQQLAPEMRRIAEENKNDLEKRAAAQRELFQKHNYNPLAGCLPMFFQLPIFVGLYRALSVDIELRQAALIPGLHWCSNLAGPDQFLNWESFMPMFLASRTGWLGPYLNILPLISVTFMMIHQKMFTPPPTDEQQEMQQKVMKFMMLFMAFMFFRVPAGLCLYFITSSAWGLAERMLLPKPKLTAAGTLAVTPAIEKPAAAVRSSSSERGLLGKLRELADDAMKAQPQNEKRRNKNKRH